MSIVVPAVLPASKKEFDEALAIVTRIPSVTRIQIDVVDGNFASPASWPYAAPAELADMAEKGDMLPRLDRIAYEIDLMCLDAETAAQAWLTIGATRLTFHAESAPDLSRLIRSTRSRYGHFVAFGLALNIESDAWLLETNLAEVEYVQFMGIARIGRQGQPFDWRVIEKIRAFRERA
jgi:pentose-5-phosphate-3-epimerase